MGTSSTIFEVNGTTYMVATDVMTTYSAVITGAVTDEIFGTFTMPGFAVEMTRNDLQTKATAEGLYAVTGRPAISFPQLSTTSYPINYTLVAPGFRDYAMEVLIPVNATFPVSAVGAPMRRLPVRLQGRVVSDSNGLPVAGAMVMSVDNPTPPSPPPPPPIAHSMLLRSPLCAAHAAGAPVQAVTLTQTGSTQLAQPSTAGTTTVFLNATSGLSGSAFLQIMTPDKTLLEYATVMSLGPATGQVNLATPLTRSYGAGAAATVNFVTAALAGSAAHLLADPNIGDGIVVADALLTASTLAIDSGAAVEYHEVGAVTDSMGYYAFNGVGRVQELFLEANGSTPPTPWMIEFDQPINIVNFSI